MFVNLSFKMYSFIYSTADAWSHCKGQTVLINVHSAPGCLRATQNAISKQKCIMALTANSPLWFQIVTSYWLRMRCKWCGLGGTYLWAMKRSWLYGFFPFAVEFQCSFLFADSASGDGRELLLDQSQREEIWGPRTICPTLTFFLIQVQR